MAEGTRKIIRLKVTESTNSVALAAGAQGESAGTVVIADEQTGGRGRLKRAWLSPPGMGLYFSMILKPDLAAEDLPKITLAAGLAVCLAIESECKVFPRIKWPNDLMLAGKKFGGILTETGTVDKPAAGHQPFVVVGVGLNCFPPSGGFPAEMAERATALSLHVVEINAEILLHACIKAIEQTVQRLAAGNFSAILAEWRTRDAVRDRALSWVTPQGEKVTGVSLGPDEHGMLRIRDDKGTIHTVISGDLKLAGKVRG